MPSRHVPAATAVAALALLVSGAAAPAAGAQSPSAEGRADPRARDSLRFTVEKTGDREKDGTFVLECAPARGTHADPPGACAALQKASAGESDPFRPVDPGTPCTMISGGPATVHVVGTWHGREVDARFHRNNGCEIERWDALVPALPHV